MSTKERGNKYFAEKRYEEAIAEYTRAILELKSKDGNDKDKDKEIAILCSNRSECFLRLGQYEDALVDCERCIQLHPSFVKGYYRKGICLFHLLQYEAALPCFKEVEKLDPKNTQVIQKIKEITDIFQRNDDIRKDIEERSTEAQYKEFPVAFKYEKSKGRAVYASRDIQEGENILRVKGAVAVLEDKYMTSHCSGCFIDLSAVPDSDKLSCSKCKKHVLCFKCRDIPSHQQTHEGECPILQSLFSLASQYFIENSRDQRLLFRLLLLHIRETSKSNVDLRQGHSGLFIIDKYPNVKSLSYNLNLDPMQVEAFHESAAVALNFVSNHTNHKVGVAIEDIVALQCAILQNAHEIMEPLTSLVVGIGLFPTAAYLNHSCYPNCSFYVDNEGFLCFNCIRAISEGEELCFSYIDIMRPTRERQKQLMNQYCFKCECERCTDQAEDVYLEGCMCSRAGCGDLLQPFQNSHLEIQDQVYECGKCKKREKLLPFIELEDKVVEMYEQAKSSDPPNDALIREALAVAGSKLHRFHFMKCVMRRTLADLDAATKQWDKLVVDSTELLATYSFIFPDDPFILSQEIGKRYYQMAKGMRELNHPKAAATAKMAVTIFGICIGTNHTVLQQIKKELLLEPT